MKFNVYYADPFAYSFSPVLRPREQYKKVTTLEANDLEVVFDEMNHHDVDNHIDRLVARGEGIRSLSVGDIVVDEKGVASMCMSFGWEVVPFKEEQD